MWNQTVSSIAVALVCLLSSGADQALAASTCQTPESAEANNGVTLKVLEGCVYSDNYRGEPVESGSQVVEVEVILQNDNPVSVSANSRIFALFDADASGFKGSFRYDPPLALPLLDIANGESARGRIAFEIPATSRPASLRYATRLVRFGDLGRGAVEIAVPF